MEKYQAAAELSPEDKAIADRFDKEYVPGVTVVKRAKSAAMASRKVNVYVDGLLTTMDEDALNRLIDIGFYIVVTRRP